jgi:hypothetical protein
MIGIPGFEGTVVWTLAILSRKFPEGHRIFGIVFS